MMEAELRIYELDPEYRWNWTDWYGRTFANSLLGRFLSYRDDATFVSLHRAPVDWNEAVAASAPTPPRKSIVRRLVPAHGSTVTEHEHFARIQDSPVLEIRQYRLVPGTRARFARFFHDRTLETHFERGMPIYGQFDAREDENLFVFLRGFPDLAERDRRKAAFYQSDYWLQELQDEAFSMIEDYSNVLLVMPVSADSRTAT
jgi:NIPSNAP